MALNFVAKAVIRSEDGVTFNKETKIKEKEGLEGTKRKKRTKGPIMPIGKSLAEQLADNEEKKDAEWKAKNNPFQPKPAMTEEEAEFLKEKRMEELRKDLEIEELKNRAALELKAARLSDITVKPAAPVPKVEGLFHAKVSEIEERNTEANPVAVKVKVKKRKKDGDGSEGKKKKKKKKKKKTGGALAGLLGNY
ncbi:hypothetical protein AAMO2058_001447900 [Amorphochlora amoebiformis]